MQWAKQKQTGFTIVELLIVVVVIAILAAITIVSYNGITSRANNTAVQNDLSNLAKKIEMIRAEGSSYPLPLTASMGLTATKGSYEVRNNLYYCLSAAGDQFALGAVSKSGTGYMYTSRGGLTGPVSVSGAAVCDRVGQSGWDSSYTYTQLGHNTDQPGTRGWAAWLQ